MHPLLKKTLDPPLKPFPIKIAALIFQLKNSAMKLSGLNIFREYAKKP